MKIFVLHHVLNEMSAPKAATQILSHPGYKLPFQNAPAMLTASPPSTLWPHQIPTCLACPSHFVHLENSYSFFKGNSEITFSVKLFLTTSKAVPSLLLVLRDTWGRSPLCCSPYFIIVNCVHICLPHCSMCLPFKGKDNVLPISHPSSIQQSMRHVVSI